MEFDMSTTKLVECHGCQKHFEKPTKYITAAEKKGRRHYCSLSCQAIHKNKTDPRFRHNENLKRGGKERDEFSDFRWMFARTKARQKSNISLEEIKDQWDKQKGLCAVSGLPLKLRKKGVSIFEQASLDRIDSSKPYEKGNIQFIILSLNYAKSTANNEEFISFVRSLSNHTHHSLLAPE